MKRLFCLVVFMIAVLVAAQNSDAAPIIYTANLDGPSESPPNASPGFGFATVIFDSVAHIMEVDVSFGGLLGNVTASHIHGPTAVAGSGTAAVATQTPTFVGFPLGVTSGTYYHVFDMIDTSSYRAGFIADNGGTVAGAEAVLAASLAAGTAYFNIHTNLFPGGEIRGFLTASVPEPTTMLLLGLGLVGIAGMRRKMQR